MQNLKIRNKIHKLKNNERIKKLKIKEEKNYWESGGATPSPQVHVRTVSIFVGGTLSSAAPFYRHYDLSLASPHPVRQQQSGNTSLRQYSNSFLKYYTQ